MKQFESHLIFAATLESGMRFRKKEKLFGARIATEPNDFFLLTPRVVWRFHFADPPSLLHPGLIQATTALFRMIAEETNSKFDEEWWLAKLRNLEEHGGSARRL